MTGRKHVLGLRATWDKHTGKYTRVPLRPRLMIYVSRFVLDTSSEVAILQTEREIAIFI